MALTKCPECSKEVSTQAAACPHCGCPLKATEQPSASTPPTPTPAPQPAAASLPSPATLGCAAMILFFFMPWAQLLGFSASGYDLQKLGSYGNLAWLIPVFSGITIVVGFYGKRQKELAQLTGALPLLGLVYALVKVGPDVFHVLAIGAYLTLITAVALLSVVPRMTSIPAAGGSGSPLKPKRAEQFKCPECGQQVNVSWFDGVVKRCPSCGEAVRIPEVPVSGPTNVA